MNGARPTFNPSKVPLDTGFAIGTLEGVFASYELPDDGSANLVTVADQAAIDAGRAIEGGKVAALDSLGKPPRHVAHRREPLSHPALWD